jgi:hypothetical protein
VITSLRVWLTLLLDTAVESPIAAQDTKMRIANGDCKIAYNVGANCQTRAHTNPEVKTMHTAYFGTSRNGSVGTANKLQAENRDSIFPLHNAQNGSESSCSMRTGSLHPRGLCGRGVKLITHPLVLGLKCVEPYPHPPYAVAEDQDICKFKSIPHSKHTPRL